MSGLSQIAAQIRASTLESIREATHFNQQMVEICTSYLTFSLDRSFNSWPEGSYGDAINKNDAKGFYARVRTIISQLDFNEARDVEALCASHFTVYSGLIAVRYTEDGPMEFSFPYDQYLV